MDWEEERLKHKVLEVKHEILKYWATVNKKKLCTPKSKLCRFPSLSKLEHLVSITIIYRFWLNWLAQDQNRYPYQRLHKNWEFPLHYETMSIKHRFAFPGRETQCTQPRQQRRRLLGEGKVLPPGCTSGEDKSKKAHAGHTTHKLD